MTKALRILLVEDSEQESELVCLQLKFASYAVEHRRVQTAQELEAALLEGNWEVVLADLILPQYSGMAALRLVKRLRPELPVIVYSGRYGDDIAVDALQAGAFEYVPKGSQARLLVAIERAIQRKQPDATPLPATSAPAALAAETPPAPAARSRRWPRLLLAAGLALLLAAPVWRFGLAGRWLQRLPPGWALHARFVGIATYPDPVTGIFPEEDATAFYFRDLYLTGDSHWPDAVTAVDHYRVVDPATDKTEYDYTLPAHVDPRTGQNLDFPGETYFAFPRRVQQKTYRLAFSYHRGTPATFESEDDVEGLRTYVFAYRGPMEYTAFYAGTPESPGTVVEPGQEIRCADDQYVFRMWVEPVTGEMVKWEESCYSGDYVFDASTGEAQAAVTRWGGATTGDTVLLRVAEVQRQRASYLWADLYLPALLAALGLAALAFGMLLSRGQR